MKEEARRDAKWIPSCTAYINQILRGDGKLSAGQHLTKPSPMKDLCETLNHISALYPSAPHLLNNVLWN